MWLVHKATVTFSASDAVLHPQRTRRLSEASAMDTAVGVNGRELTILSREQVPLPLRSVGPGDALFSQVRLYLFLIDTLCVDFVYCG